MKLTKEEKAWVKRVNKVLSECPSERMMFFAGGDTFLLIADRAHEDEINANGNDPAQYAQSHGYAADENIVFPYNVDAVCF